MRYSTIKYMQGDEADEVLDIMDEHGHDAAMDHLMKWDHGEDHDVRDEPPYPPNYWTHERDMGDFVYVMAWSRIGDISLQRVTA